MLGIGPRLNTVFKSRWRAAIWSMGVLLVAYCSVPSADPAVQHTPAKVAQAKPHHSPWAY
jgi:hypothetical protein